MKKFLLMTTGGTIASQQGEDGLKPKIAPEGLLAYVKELQAIYEIDSQVVLNMDSSNIQPEEWRIIAKQIYERLPEYDGIVVTHGTDTMAYTAAMLSFMLRDLDKPVILTGSQIPIDSYLTDARANLYCAFEVAASGIQGVYVVFNRKIIKGTRAVKVRTMGFDAFESVNLPDVGEIYSGGIVWQHEQQKHYLQPRLMDQLEPNVFLVKLIPGTRPEIFDHLTAMGYKGIVIEAFGAGGMHFLRRNLVEKLELLKAHGIVVVACSQCLYERCDFSLYEVGTKLLACDNVIPAHDMTTEAAVTKLMWALGNAGSLSEVKQLFLTELCGEITHGADV